jgi:hypothetical protein
MVDYRTALISAKRLQDDYLEKRQSVGLETLRKIQETVARDLLASILDTVNGDCEEIGGFLSDALKREVESLTKPGIERNNDRGC